MRETLYVLPASFAALASLAMLVVTLRRRKAPGAVSYAALMAGVAFWCAMQALYVMAEASAAKLWISKAQYLGIVVVPVAGLVFALDHGGRRGALGPWRLAALCVIPAVTLALAVSNEWHGLVWAGVQLDESGPIGLLSFQYGPWFRVHTAYSYLLILAAGSVVTWRLAQLSHFRMLQVGFLVAIALVLSANVAYVSGVRILGGLDPTPAGFALAGVVVGLCFHRYRMFDLVPLARETVFDGLADPVIALDERGRLLDLNLAARLQLVREREPVGRPAAEVLPAPLPGLLANLGPRGRAEVTVGGGAGVVCTYDVLVTPLGSGTGASGSLLVLRDITQLKDSEIALLETQERLRQANSQLAHLANTDPLTGLTNRRRWVSALGIELDRARRHGISLGVVMIDVDYFKRVNDEYGHLAGDRVLQAVARVLEDQRRSQDVAGRMGGEEFALLVTHASARGLEIVAERVRGHVETMRVRGDDGEELSVTVSVGTALFAPAEDASAADLETLLRSADAALYRAKETGRNRVVAA